jgi:uncharacterized protein
MLAAIKVSNYNVLTRLQNGSVLAYNAMSQATAIWDSTEADMYDRIASGFSPEETPSRALSDLAAGGFVVPADTDELSLLEAEYSKARYSKRSWGITIAPTLACNFGCDYCFQGPDKPAGKMSQQIQDATIAYIRRVLDRGVVRDFGVAWYGGEPLLARDLVESMSAQIAEACRSRSVSYSAVVVTNGFMLDGRTARMLVANHVNTAQVTLDGAAPSHDKRRVLLSGGGTFERIVRNLRVVLDESELRVSIRVNIDGRNADEIPDLLHNLAAAGFANRKRFSVYFAPVEAITEGCHAVAALTLGKSEYAQMESRLIQLAHKLGLCQLPYPGRFRGLCGAVRPEARVGRP